MSDLTCPEGNAFSIRGCNTLCLVCELLVEDPCPPCSIGADESRDIPRMAGCSTEVALFSDQLGCALFRRARWLGDKGWGCSRSIVFRRQVGCALFSDEFGCALFSDELVAGERKGWGMFQKYCFQMSSVVRCFQIRAGCAVVFR